VLALHASGIDHTACTWATTANVLGNFVSKLDWIKSRGAPVIQSFAFVPSRAFASDVIPDFAAQALISGSYMDAVSAGAETLADADFVF
jgi:hypothetical protein